jgi:hypothetical protein
MGWLLLSFHEMPSRVGGKTGESSGGSKREVKGFPLSESQFLEDIWLLADKL